MKNLYLRFCIVGVMTVLLAACGPAGKEAENLASPRIVADQLDKVTAEARRARVDNLAYTMEIDLTAETDAFSGIITIDFDLSAGPGPLTVDFTGGEVAAMEINGAEAVIDYNGFFITLPDSALAEGANSVTITYSHPYSQDGTGLHRFIDPEDGLTYLYTYLWPYYANRLFPSFDQPNMKATYKLTVRAPADWQVVSAARESAIEDEGETRLWIFPETKKFSTYIFSLHAGPYAVFEDTAGDIPIRLFARQSLAPYVAWEEWFTFTRQGLDFYARYFDIPYPFGKYDQLMVPDFNIGAMENVAAVTFTERFVQRGPSNRFQREARASTILHEMAHMWFGDLVTKDWWNGLWLNESFATYMSALAVSEATEFSDSWHGFFLSSNLSAFAADELVTTHPIEVPVPSTADFFSIFDAITYGKGASVLNQLSHFIGPDVYRQGVSAYLKKYSYGNTRLEDFIGALSEASGQDLTGWAEAWLYHAGVNSLEARYTCDGGRISAFTILQTAPAALPTLRQQRIQLGLYGMDEDGSVGTVAVLPVDIAGAETPVPGAIGRPCPALVLPNHGDWGYAKITLDEETLKNLPAGIGNIEDPLLRSMFWYALSDAAIKGEFGFEDFLMLVEHNLAGESNERVMQQILNAAADVLSLLDRLRPASDAVYAENVSRIPDALIAELSGPAEKPGLRALWLDALISEARSDQTLVLLEKLLSDEVQFDGITIDRPHRWAIIEKLNEWDRPGAAALLENELANDSSDEGQRQAIAAEAGRPDITSKRRWLVKILDSENPLPLSRLRSAMEALFPSHQTALQAILLPEILGALPDLSKHRGPYFLASLGRTLLYGACTVTSVGLLGDLLASGMITEPTALRFLKESRQRDAACLELRVTLEGTH